MNDVKNNMLVIGRIIAIIFTLLLSIFSFIITIVALATSKWQIVYLSEFQSMHYHGLWLDCTQNRISQSISNII